MRQPKVFVLHTAAGAISLATMLRALAEAKLVWRLHPAQLLSLEIQTMYLNGATEVSVDKLKTTALLPEPVPYTIMGFPVDVSWEYPKTMIRLCRGEEVIAQIEQLAVPCAFGSTEWPDTKDNAAAQKWIDEVWIENNG